MYTDDYVCHQHQCHASECGCSRNICPIHEADLTPFGGDMVCLYCDWGLMDEVAP